MEQERDSGSRDAGPMPLRRPRSLRLLLSGWTVAVFTATLALFTAAGIVEERRQILRNETEEARALVEHVAQMPEFKVPSSSAEAAPHLASLRDLLRAAGADLEMTPRLSKAREGSAGPAEPTTGTLAVRQVSLSDGTFDLRYRKDPGRFREMAARSAMIHTLHGLLALAALIAGTEWILRRRLLAPLARISHQVDHMRSGGGWLTILPRTDSELQSLAGAVGRLGPALELQVQQWVEAERRAAVAFMLHVVRSELREPVREVQARASDLEARGLVSPSGKQELRALVAATDRLREALAAADRMTFAQQPPSNPDETLSTEGTHAS